MALVIFRVFCTLLILVRISLIPAIVLPVRALPREVFAAVPLFVWAAEAALANHNLKSTVLFEIFNGCSELGLIFLGHFFFVLDALNQSFVLGFQGVAQGLLERLNLFDFEVVKVALGDAEQRNGKLPDLEWLILRLLQKFNNTLTALELATGRVVEVGSKLGKRCQFTVLSQVGTNTAGQFLDHFGLGCTTHTRYRNTSVDGGTHTGVEQVGLKEDLAVSNRNHVGRNERGNVAGLSFDDGQSRKRTCLAFNRTLGELLDIVGVDTSSALEQTGVQVEHVAGIGFASGRTTQQQRNLTIGPCLLGKVVVHDQGVFATIAEVFAHGAAGVSRQILHGCRVGRRSGYNNGVFHGAV